MKKKSVKTKSQSRRERIAVEAMKAIISKAPFEIVTAAHNAYPETAHGAVSYADALMKALDK